jgi:hypothetical protein
VVFRTLLHAAAAKGVQPHQDPSICDSAQLQIRSTLLLLRLLMLSLLLLLLLLLTEVI